MSLRFQILIEGVLGGGIAIAHLASNIGSNLIDSARVPSAQCVMQEGLFIFICRIVLK